MHSKKQQKASPIHLPQPRHNHASKLHAPMPPRQHRCPPMAWHGMPRTSWVGPASSRPAPPSPHLLPAASPAPGFCVPAVLLLLSASAVCCHCLALSAALRLSCSCRRCLMACTEGGAVMRGGGGSDERGEGEAMRGGRGQ